MCECVCLSAEVCVDQYKYVYAGFHRSVIVPPSELVCEDRSACVDYSVRCQRRRQTRHCCIVGLD